MSERTERMERLATRRAPRGAEVVVAASVKAAARRRMTKRPSRRRIALAVGALMAVAAGVGVFASARSGSRTGRNVITSGGTPGAAAARSLLGSVAWVDGQGMSILPGVDGTQRRIAGPPACCVSWSFDGRFLAYQSGDVLHVVRSDGSGDRVVAAGVARGEWSPRSDVFAWLPANPASSATGVNLWSADSGLATSIAVAGLVNDLAWSHAGTSLAVATYQPGQPTTVLHILIVGGSNDDHQVAVPSPMRTQAGTDTLVLGGWQPDDRGLLVWIDEGGSSSIAMDGLPLWLLPLDGSSPHRLGTTLVKRSWIKWKPDGSRVAIVRSTARFVADGDRTVTLCARDGTCTPLSGPDVQTMDPEWSPDGEQLTYVSRPVLRGAVPLDARGSPQWGDLYSSRQLWIADAEGNSPRHLDAGGGVASPTWSADGTRVVYLRGEALWAIDPTTSRTSQLLAPIRSTGSPASPADEPYEPGAADERTAWESLVDWTLRH